MQHVRTFTLSLALTLLLASVTFAGVIGTGDGKTEQPPPPPPAESTQQSSSTTDTGSEEDETADDHIFENEIPVGRGF